MARVIVLALALVCSAGPASASAGFGCRAADQNVIDLALEGATPRDGDTLISLAGVIEIVPGHRIEFGKAEVVKFVWKKTLQLDIRKQLAGKSFVEIRIRTRMDDDETSFPGTYAVRTETRSRAGRLNCSGG